MEPAHEIGLRRTFGSTGQTEDRKSLADKGYDLDLFVQALIESFKKFDPRVQIHNPVMFRRLARRINYRSPDSRS